MERRSFLNICVAGVAGALFLGDDAWPEPKKKPNIVLVIADDQLWRDSGCYGNSQVQTPNIDKLAAQGVRFTRCFTATAMCAPTRQQLYTGIFPVRNGAYPNHSRVKDGTRSIVYYLRDLGYRVGIVGKRHFNPIASFPFEFLDDDNRFGPATEARTIAEFIERDPEQPYFLVYASKEPHLPWKSGDVSRYDPAALEIPPYMIDTPETRDALCRYYAEITYLDGEVGRCMAAVDESKGRDDTLFVYTSEQGMQAPFAKWTCYDLGLRTAFVARWPERVKAGTEAHAMIQYVDFVPTCIEAAGGTPPPDLDGKSFLPVLLGEKDEHNDVVYGVHTNQGIRDGFAYPVRSIRTETHKYIWNLHHEGEYRNVMMTKDRENFYNSWVEKAKTDPAAARRMAQYLDRPEEELYDITKDPYELENLAADPQYKDLMASLRKKLEAWMAQQGDKGMETEKAAMSRLSLKKR